MLKRKCKHIITSPDGRRALYVDLENEKEILEYWNRDPRHLDKFRFIADLLLKGLYTRKHYCKVEINHECKNVTEMRFFVGQENDRVYCKEMRNSHGVYVIIAAILHERKGDFSSKESSLIQKVGGYNYEL